jgi:hypothetical protein
VPPKKKEKKSLNKKGMKLCHLKENGGTVDHHVK